MAGGDWIYVAQDEGKRRTFRVHSKETYIFIINREYFLSFGNISVSKDIGACI